MFKSKCSKGRVWHIILIIWLIFATLYVAYGEYNRLNNYVAARSYSAGLQDAVTKIIVEAQKCKSVPVNVGELSATLVNLECLQKPVEEAVE